MESPTDVGAPAATVPAGRAAGTSVAAPRHGRAATALVEDDATLIARVREGDMDAYGELYERHVATARRLAGRLCRDPHEVDDVVSEVFANTLRALRRGSGPNDDLKPYLLRSLRHTVVNLRTRKDTGRATPTADAELDQPSTEEPIRFADAVSHAFVELPPRFQDVLWMTCIEGRTPVEVGRTSDLEPGAVASLAHRARRALGRSYLSVATRQPHVPAGCAPIREVLPSYVQGTTAPATARRVHQHLNGCDGCTSVSREMTHLNKSLASVSSIALLEALIRRWRGAAAGSAGGIGAGTVVPLAMIAVATSTLLSGGSSLADERTPTGAPDRPTLTSISLPTDPGAATTTAGRILDLAPDAADRAAGPGTPLAPANDEPATGTLPIDTGVDALDPANIVALLEAIASAAGDEDPAATDPPALDLSALDLSALDLSAIDLSALDPAVIDAILASLGLDGIDLSAIDLSAIDLSAVELPPIDLSALDPDLVDAALRSLELDAAPPLAPRAGAPLPSSATSGGAPVDAEGAIGPTATTVVTATTLPSTPPVPTTLPPAPTTVPPVPTTLPPAPTTVPPVPSTLPPAPTTVPPVPSTLPGAPLGGLDVGV